jgi:hypothetical protein
MTIERERPKRRWSTPVKAMLWAGLVVVGWLSFAAASAAFAPPGRSFAVIGPSDRALNAIAASGGHIVQTGNYITIAHADDAGFVGRLYANGAWFVVDADGAGGCGAVVKRLVRF